MEFTIFLDLSLSPSSLFHVFDLELFDRGFEFYFSVTSSVLLPSLTLKLDLGETCVFLWSTTSFSSVFIFLVCLIFGFWHWACFFFARGLFTSSVSIFEARWGVLFIVDGLWSESSSRKRDSYHKAFCSADILESCSCQVFDENLAEARVSFSILEPSSPIAMQKHACELSDSCFCHMGNLKLDVRDGDIGDTICE